MFYVVWGIEQQSYLAYAYLVVPASCSTICWKVCPFSIQLPLHLCKKSVVHTYVGLFLNFLFYTIGYVSVLSPIPYCLDLSSFVTILKTGSASPLNLFFFKLLWLFEFFYPTLYILESAYLYLQIIVLTLWLRLN